MIYLTRINHSSLILNPDLIEHIQTTPDTVITLTSGRNYLVIEPAEEVIRRIVEYRRMLLAKPALFESKAEQSGTGVSSGSQR
jgi:flagellar protein FlbD